MLNLYTLMDHYPYSEKMVEDLDATLDVLKKNADIHLHPDFIYPPLGIERDEYARCADIKDAILALGKRGYVHLNEHGDPKIRPEGLAFLEAGGFTRQRKAFYLDIKSKEVDRLSKKELQELQIEDLKKRLASAEKQLKLQSAFWETSTTRNRWQVFFIAISVIALLLSMASTIVVLIYK